MATGPFGRTDYLGSGKPTLQPYPRGQALRGETKSVGVTSRPCLADALLVLQRASGHHTQPEYDQVAFSHQQSVVNTRSFCYSRSWGHMHVQSRGTNLPLYATHLRLLRTRGIIRPRGEHTLFAQIHEMQAFGGSTPRWVGVNRGGRDGNTELFLPPLAT